MPLMMLNRATVAEKGRDIAEELALRRHVVDRVVIRRRIFDADIVGQQLPGDVELRIADRAAIIEARHERRMAAAVDAQAAARLICPAACLDIDHACRVQAILGRQSAVEQCQAN